MKYLITVSYDGSKYWGLQKLKNKNTVQGELERVLSKMNDAPISVKASGRTDRGVHALEQKCHFELNKETTPYRLRYYLNRETSPYLYVKDCIQINDEDFHARFSVKSKKYLYKINTGEYNPILNDYLYNYNKPLNLELLKEAASLIEGPHNFKVFVTGKHKTYDSIIDYIKIKKNKNIIELEIKGKAFYTYMIRNIISILILYSEGKITKGQIEKMLDRQERVIEYAMVPANGLYLKEIKY